MEGDRKGLAIILHSGSYDRIYHGLSIASIASALGREVKLFFTYWALEYLRREKSPTLSLDREGENHKDVLEKGLEKGHMKQISELLARAKRVGTRCYACVNSMALLNITRDELVDEVDESTGLATFLQEAEDAQILFV